MTFSILATSVRQRSASLFKSRFFAMAASSFPASTNRPAMNTDSATLPSLFVVVWNDCPGVSEKQLRFRQSFQSARPMSGRAAAPPPVHRRVALLPAVDRERNDDVAVGEGGPHDRRGEPFLAHGAHQALL